jgi:8-oxo-dGTP pyrophosphatase MutT (NUDIX family)
MNKYLSFLDQLKTSTNSKLLENVKSIYTEGLTYDESESFGGAGFMFICPKTRRVLIGKRSKDGKWADFGGGREDNEKPMETAIREVSEELQFYPDMYSILPNPLVNVEDDGYIFYNFLATVDDEIIPDINEEHSEVEWISISDLGKYDLLQGMINIFSHSSNVQRIIDIMDGKVTNANYIEEHENDK